MDLRDAHLPEAGPCGRCRRPAFALGEQLTEAALPALAERRNSEGPFELWSRLVGEVEQGVHLRDGQPFGAVSDLGDRIAGLHLSFLDHAEVEPRAMVGDQQRGHRRFLHADPDPVAGHPRLGDLEQRASDAVAVPYADLLVGEAFHGEVLPELSVAEIVPSQLAFPVPVGLDLVDEHRPVLPAVREPVRLVVAVDVDPPHHPRPLDRFLPDGCADGLSLPLDLTGAAHIDRQQPPGHRRARGRHAVRPYRGRKARDAALRGDVRAAGAEKYRGPGAPQALASPCPMSHRGVRAHRATRGRQRGTSLPTGPNDRLRVGR